VERTNPKKIVAFSSTDADNPYNWPARTKRLIFVAGMVSVIQTSFGSSLPSGATNFIAESFHVTDDLQLVLPISCFLAGYVVGPTLCGPLSENFGRKPVLLSSFCLYIVSTVACAVAPTWPSLLFFRFCCGVFASGPIAIVGGLYADVYNDPRQRGTAMAWFIVATTGGPVLAPSMSGFIAENVSWRWIFAVGALFAAACLPLVMVMPESYAPVLLGRKAKKLRDETGDPDIIAKTDLQKKSTKYVVTVVLTRPYRMLFHELIVACVCVYLALAYAIFYLFFEVYPIVFQGPDSVYGWSNGLAGLAFIPIGIGALATAPIFLWWDSYLAKAQRRNAPWSQVEEYRRLPLACLGGPLYVVSLFWIGWTARPDVHWMVPVASGLLFGTGFLCIFMALLNYLTDAYETFAASAQGMASTCRSIFAVLLPLASKRMFGTLGIAWACSLLAFLSMAVAVIPFAFIKYGDRIRANSKFCQRLKELKATELQENIARRDGHGENGEKHDQQLKQEEVFQEKGEERV